MGDGKVHDMMLGALHDPFGHGHMGITAENISRRCRSRLHYAALCTRLAGIDRRVG